VGGGWLDHSSPLGPDWTSERVGALLQRGLALRTHYLAPEVQIPLEVGLLHTAFLMFLERFKDVIGTFEFHALVFLSKKLELNRFLLPYTYKVISPRVNFRGEEVKGLSDLSSTMMRLYRQVNRGGFSLQCLSVCLSVSLLLLHDVYNACMRYNEFNYSVFLCLV
jgi:hypothetical protein